MTALLLAGCRVGGAAFPASCEHHLELELWAGEHINPSDDGVPLPVAVRVYQLRDRGKLEAADATTLAQRDSEILAGDVIASSELILFPESRAIRELVRKPEAGYLAVVAQFRRPAGDQFRRVLALPEMDALRTSCRPEGSEHLVARTRVRLVVEGSQLLGELDDKVGGDDR
jgi:type VI secretion system VasD/TssJ family lipoprotein